MDKRLCILLPAFNEAKKIGPLLEDISKLTVARTRISILVVDDGSSDETSRIARHRGALVLSHQKNRGVGAAFRTGLSWIVENDFDYLLHMDADGQIPSTEIPKLLAPVMEETADIAIGTRFRNGCPEKFSRWKGLVLSTLARIVGVATGYRVSDISCGVRCMNRKVMNVLKPRFDYDYIQQTFIQSLLVHPRLIEVPVSVIYDQTAERSGMGAKIWTYGWHFVGITGISILDFYWKRLLERLALFRGIKL